MKPYIIAEIGNNHEGDHDRCLRMVREACDTGVSAVKLQWFEADKLVAKEAASMAHTQGQESQYERLKRMELPLEVIAEAGIICHGKGREYIITPFAPELVSEAANHADKIKVASGDLTYEPLLRAIRETGKPSILSTGMSDTREIYTAFDILSPWALLHCVSLYPCPDESADLHRLQGFKGFHLPTLIGYSDHTIGKVACIGAVALGATVLEKHFTLPEVSHLQTGDHKLSVTPGQMSDLVYDVNRMATMMETSPRADAKMRQHLRRGESGLRG